MVPRIGRGPFQVVVVEQPGAQRKSALSGALGGVADSLGGKRPARKCASRAPVTDLRAALASAGQWFFGDSPSRVSREPDT
jgi:hypothetical protein